MTALSLTQLVTFVYAYFLFLWAIHNFLDEYMDWKPRVFVDASKEVWNEYQYRASNSVTRKSSANYVPNVRLEKSAAIAVLRSVNQVLLFCIAVYSMVYTPNKFRAVFVADTKHMEKWRCLEIGAAMLFTLYTYELSAITRYRLSLHTAAHHILTVAGAMQVMTGSYVPVALSYGFWGIALQPIHFTKVLFIRYAVSQPTLTRRSLQVASVWYLLTAGICNTTAVLVICVLHATRGQWLRSAISLFCFCVWILEDFHLLKWLRAVSQIEYRTYSESGGESEIQVELT